MRRKLILFATALMVMTACKKEEKSLDGNTTLKDTTTVATETSEEPKDSLTIKKAWDDYAKIGEQQQMLAKDDGVWNEEVTAWETADAKPYKVTTTGNSKMIMGGRYKQMTHSGTFMGAPFEGMETVGYDNASGKWNSSWTDNMSTGISYMTGDYDSATKTITFTGEMVSPVSKKVKKMRQTYIIVDDNTRKIQSFNIGTDGKEFKSMEIVLTRKK